MMLPWKGIFNFTTNKKKKVLLLIWTFKSHAIVLFTESVSLVSAVPLLNITPANIHTCFNTNLIPFLLLPLHSDKEDIQSHNWSWGMKYVRREFRHNSLHFLPEFFYWIALNNHFISFVTDAPCQPPFIFCVL